MPRNNALVNDAVGCVSHTYLNLNICYLMTRPVLARAPCFSCTVVWRRDDIEPLIFLSVLSTAAGFTTCFSSQASDTLDKSHHWFSTKPADQSGAFKRKDTGPLTGLNTCCRFESLVLVCFGERVGGIIARLPHALPTDPLKHFPKGAGG